MQDRKLPRKQGNAREYVKIVICPGSIEGLGKSYSSGGARPKDYRDGKRRDLGIIQIYQEWLLSIEPLM